MSNKYLLVYQCLDTNFFELSPSSSVEWRVVNNSRLLCFSFKWYIHCLNLFVAASSMNLYYRYPITPLIIAKILSTLYQRLFRNIFS